MKNDKVVKKTVVSNIQVEKAPSTKVVRHPTSRAFKCLSTAVVPCPCIIQPPHNSTRMVVNSIQALRERKFDPDKLLREKLRQNDMLIKSVNQKAALKVSIPFDKRQYQDLIDIDLSSSMNDSM